MRYGFEILALRPPRSPIDQMIAQMPGSRVSGLITPSRPMSLEAAAGKNPVTHVGNLYNVMAHRSRTPSWKPPTRPFGALGTTGLTLLEHGKRGSPVRMSAQEHSLS